MNDRKIYLKAEFSKIWTKIASGENITLLRFADGERAIMMGQSVSAQEGGWASPNYLSNLGKALLDSMTISGEYVYSAISCPCCDQPAYYWYASRVPENAKVTFANMWINANYNRFIRAFETLDREAVVVANFRSADKRIGNLKILKHYSISDDCFDFWDTQAEQMLSEIKKDFGDKKNLLFVISAGPMSEPIIAELYRHNPDNAYIDFGSSIDRYYRGKKTRPYEDPWSIYSRRNCWMYDPETAKFDVTAVLTLYKRPEKLVEQLDALEKQTVKPREILLFHDAATPLIVFELDEKTRSRITNYIKVEKNVGVWGRFAGGLLATSKYVCFFDDDTIPGSRWLENCLTQMHKRKGLYGAIGIDAWNLSNYPYRGFRRWGWGGPCETAKEVDFVGHSWFLEKDWLGAMWINNSQYYAFKYVAEDAFLSYSLKRWLGIKTYVPPHPKNDLELYGSMPDTAEAYGQEAESAISLNPQHLERMNQAIKLLVAQGMRNSSLRLSNIFSRDYILSYAADNLIPKNSRRRKFALRILDYARENLDAFIIHVVDRILPKGSRIRDTAKKILQHIK